MAAATLVRAGESAERARWPRRVRPQAVRATGPLPPLSSRLQLIRAALMMTCALSAMVFLQLTVIGRVQHASAQQRMYDEFRAQLALGTAPVGPAEVVGYDPTGAPIEHELALGTPVAYMEIPAIALSEVVGEGTTAGVLLDGPGHRRDTMLPGQAGTTAIFGRRSSFGGPFGKIDELAQGDEIRLVTGQGTFTYEVLGVRYEGTPVPPTAAADSSRLVLVTAAGNSFRPDGVLRVDADLVGQAVGGAGRAYTSVNLPESEGTMAGDPSTLWALALWLIALGGLAVAVAWAWPRWGRAQAWIAGFPPLLLVGLAASGEAIRLLPNLL